MIPTSGINGGEEQERRATSALLAVMGSVKEFGRALTRPLGAPAGVVQTFIEVPFVLQDRKLFPDGVIRVRRGQKTWTALVEVKTGNATLDPVQLENYLDIARAQGYDALLTISNEIAPLAGQHPTPVDKRRTRAVALHHYSWSQVLTEAVVQREHRGVADPDQAWILGELIRYLEHSRSGALEFDDMGPTWVPVRDAVLTGTLRPADAGAAQVANQFDALLRYASLKLGRRLGTNVVPLVTRKEQTDPALRVSSLVASLSSSGTLSGAIRIPDAIGTVAVTADIRAGRVTCSVDVDAPREGKATTRIAWLTRQLASAPDAVRVEVFAAYSKASVAAELLGTVRADPNCLVLDSGREIRSFRIALDLPLGPRRGRGKGGFPDSVLFAIETFYTDVVQAFRAWTAKTPRLRDETSPEPVAEQLVSSSLSSQDGPETADEQDDPPAIDPPAAPPARSPEPFIPAPAPPVDQTPTDQTPADPAPTDQAPLPVVPWSTAVPEPRGPSRREIRRAVTRPDSPDPQPQDAEGWYADPNRPDHLRWWDGQTWSPYVYEPQPAVERA